MDKLPSRRTVRAAARRACRRRLEPDTDHHMKVASRREAMLKAVLSGMTEVAELCEHFGMSEATVRLIGRAHV